MQLTEDRPQNQYHLTQADAQGFIINQKRYTRTILLGKDLLIDDELPSTVEAIQDKHLKKIIATSPKIVIIGTGSKQKFLSQAHLVHFYQAGIGIEVMTTAAACRTINVLLAENRDAVALLFIEQ